MTGMQPPSVGNAGHGHGGWYPDPWDPTRWRWWDGWTWTHHVSMRGKKPILPGWVSVPVLVAALLVVPIVGLVLATYPHAVFLALAPLLIVLPVMLWLDRVEPEPRAALVHALLWGATVAVAVSSIVNALVGVVTSEQIAIMVSAPIVEEITKGASILIAVRRREVDGPMDGIVYAGWTAVGFAAVENVEYFVRAVEAGQLAAVFVLRGLLAPFAHPLFTAWTGLAVGRAVARGRSPFPSAFWGLALAMASHALWNGSAVGAQVLGDVGALFLLGTVGAFVICFFTFVVVLYRVRRKEERMFCELVPWLAARYELAPHEIALFGNFGAMLRARKRLDKRQRRWFDRMHAALARLAVLHERPGGADPATEQALWNQLQRARFGTEN